jgi:hypothetical protein
VPSLMPGATRLHSVFELLSSKVIRSPLRITLAKGVVELMATKAKAFAGVRECVRDSINGDNSRGASGLGLLFLGGPPDVTRLVVPIGFFSVNRKPFSWHGSDVVKESFKTFNPFRMDGDSSASVVVEPVILRIKNASLHFKPRCVFGSYVSSAASSVNLSVVVIKREGTRPATRTSSVLEVSRCNSAFRSTGASAVPHYVSSDVRGTVEDGPLSKFEPRKVGVVVPSGGDKFTPAFVAPRAFALSEVSANNHGHVSARASACPSSRVIGSKNGPFSKLLSGHFDEITHR